MSDLRYAYNFLKASAFHDLPLPKRIAVERRPLKKAWGYYVDHPRLIVLDSSIRSADKLLRILAHEMVHASLDIAGSCDSNDHGEEFKIIASIVAERLGWRSLGV